MYAATVMFLLNIVLERIVFYRKNNEMKKLNFLFNTYRLRQICCESKKGKIQELNGVNYFSTAQLGYFLERKVDEKKYYNISLIFQIKLIHLKLHRYFPCHLRYFICSNTCTTFQARTHSSSNGWPMADLLTWWLTTHSRRNEPFPGMFQTCMILTRIESKLNP